MEQNYAFSANQCSEDPRCCTSTIFAHGRYPNGEDHRKLPVQRLSSGLQAKPIANKTLLRTTLDASVVLRPGVFFLRTRSSLWGRPHGVENQ